MLNPSTVIAALKALYRQHQMDASSFIEAIRAIEALPDEGVVVTEGIWAFSDGLVRMHGPDGTVRVSLWTGETGEKLHRLDGHLVRVVFVPVEDRP